MTGPLRQVVHVGLEVLDDAALVCRREECTRMRELHCPDCRVVCLKDSLAVESQPVPSREFATRRVGQNAPCFWSPL